MSFLSQCIVHFCLKLHYDFEFFQPTSFAENNYKCIFRYVTQLQDVRPEGINSINISWAKTLKITWEKDEELATLARSQPSQAQLLGGGNRLVKPPRCQWLAGRELQGAPRFGAVEPRKHQSLWWHLPAAQQHQVGLPQPSEHLGFWGFGSFAESYEVERFPQLWGLQHKHNMPAGGTEGCPDKAGIPRTTTSGLVCYGWTCMDALLQKQLNVLFFSNTWFG